MVGDAVSPVITSTRFEKTGKQGAALTRSPAGAAMITDARHGAYTRIDGWYNARRRRSRVGCLSPLEYERRQLMPAA